MWVTPELPRSSWWLRAAERVRESQSGRAIHTQAVNGSQIANKIMKSCRKEIAMNAVRIFQFHDPILGGSLHPVHRARARSVLETAQPHRLQIHIRRELARDADPQEFREVFQL